MSSPSTNSPSALPSPTKPEVGAFGLVRTDGLIGAIIRLTTRSQVNHAFVVVGPNRVVEARPRGAQVGTLDQYANHTVAYSNLPTTREQREQIAMVALGFVGTPYNFLDILAIALTVLGIRANWLKQRLKTSKRMICSQLVDRTLRNAGVELYDDGRWDGDVTPGDLLMLLAQLG